MGILVNTESALCVSVGESITVSVQVLLFRNSINTEMFFLIIWNSSSEDVERFGSERFCVTDAVTDLI